MLAVRAFLCIFPLFPSRFPPSSSFACCPVGFSLHSLPRRGGPQAAGRWQYSFLLRFNLREERRVAAVTQQIFPAVAHRIAQFPVPMPLPIWGKLTVLLQTVLWGFSTLPGAGTADASQVNISYAPSPFSAEKRILHFSLDKAAKWCRIASSE